MVKDDYSNNPAKTQTDRIDPNDPELLAAQALLLRKRRLLGINYVPPSGPPKPETNELQAALQAVEYKRQEMQLEHRQPQRAEISQAQQLAFAALSRPQNPVKIWPRVVLAANHGKHGGAARLWFLARSLDSKGQGWIKIAFLWSLIRFLGVDERQRRRWQADALRLGLLAEDRKHGLYRICSLAKGALALGCFEVGKPAEIGAKALTCKGWRSHVWAGFLTTTSARPISQTKKAQLTGVPERTQRFYQSFIPSKTQKNYARTNQPGSHLTGIRESGRQSAFTGRDNLVYFRLPDQVFIPNFTASPALKGRSKKAQKAINASFDEERRKGLPSVRLFFETLRGAEKKAQKLGRSAAAWNLPGELFAKIREGRRSNLWAPLALGRLTA